MNSENKNILEELKDFITSEYQKYEYNFSDDKEKDLSDYITKELANHILDQINNGDIEVPTIPFIIKIIGRDDQEFLIMYYKNFDDEFRYHIINFNDGIEIHPYDIIPQPDDNSISELAVRMERNGKLLSEIEENIESIIDRLKKILDPVLAVYRNTIADQYNCDAILRDIGDNLSRALNNKELTIEEVPYMRVSMHMIDDGQFYIVFNNDNSFQIKKWNEYVPEIELPFDIGINY